LSQTYAIGGGNVTVSITGDTGTFVTVDDGSPASPETNIFQTGGLVPAENCLFLRMDFPEGTPAVDEQSITVTYTFSHPGGVNVPSFEIFDFDAGPDQWIDEAVVMGTLALGGLVNPSSIITSASNADDGVNTATGTGGAGNTSSDGNVTFNFNQSGISSYSFVYSNPVPNVAGSHNQWACMHDISFFYPPTVAKLFSPNTIAAGSTSTLTITLGNPEATNAVLSANLVDTLPANVNVASSPNIGGTCPGTTNATAGGTTVTYTSGSVIPPGSCTITVDVTSSTPGTHTNTIAVGDLQTNFGNNTLESTDDLIVNAVAPTITKSFATDPIAYGATSNLTITLGNINTSDATLTAALVDTLPTSGNGDVVIATPANIGGTCNNADITAVSGGSTVTYANGAVIPGGGCTITVDVTSTNAGTYTNTIPAGGLQTDLGNNAIAATDDITVNAPVVPTVSKAFSPDNINLSGVSTLTITLGNTNGIDATLSAPLVDTLPTAGNGDVVIAGTPAIGGTCNSANVTATAGATTIMYASGAMIPAGGCTITVDVTSSTTGTFTNTIPIGGLQTDVGNNTVAASDDLTVAATIPPTVAKSFSPNTITAGGTSQLTITLGNTSASSITLIADMDDNLPIGVTATSVDAGSTTCTGASVDISTNTRVRYNNGATIPSGGCEIVVDVTSSSLGTVTNTILIAALQTDAGNNASPASDDLTVNGGGGGIPTCPAGTSLVNQTGNADAVLASSGTVEDPADALGAILAVGAAANTAGVSARMTGGNPGPLELDMTDSIPENATILVSYSPDNGNGGGGTPPEITIETSINGTAWIGALNLTFPVTTNVNDTLQRISYTVPSGSGPVRYIRLSRNRRANWFDGVEYSQICQPAPEADLTITKIDSVGTYTPGGTATYVITVTNGGPDDVTGAAILDSLPDGVTLSGQWSCSSTAGSSCSAANGGSIGGSTVSLTADIINTGVITINVPVQFSADMSDY